MRTDRRLYTWFLHEGLLDSLLAGDERRWRSAVRRVRTRHSQDACTRELEQWLSTHAVPSLDEQLFHGPLAIGTLVWAELPFHWSDVVRERAQRDARSSFHAPLPVDDDRVALVHGTFNPARLTCSSANSELRGIRTQYVLGHIAEARDGAIELRPVAIAARLLEPPNARPEHGDWQHVQPQDIDQFAGVDWTVPVSDAQLQRLRTVPERQVKQALAEIIGEPTVPNDWGGETHDLYTERLLVAGRRCSAAFLLKGPARFSPMTVRLLGANGDQLLRLATTPAEVLVIQHCHVIRPEVVGLLRSLACDMRNVRRYMILDGYDTYRLLAAFGYLPEA